MSWYFRVLKKYAVFEGRARRMEYWMFRLFHFMVAATIMCIYLILDVGGRLPFRIYCLATLLPNLGVNIRRMHDIGKSGGWIFIEMVPIVGPIWYLILTCTEGTSGDNAYGPDPKQIIDCLE